MKDNSSKTKSGLIWVFFGTAGQNLLQFAALVVLARLISPADFGIVSAAMIIIGLIGIFSELGVGPAIVQKLELTRDDVGTGKVISASIGLLMGLAVFAAADLFEALMRIEGLAHVVRMLAFILPIAGLTVIGQSLLQRFLEFKKYIVCIFASHVVGQLGVAIPLALLGYGFYSLIWATLAQNLSLLLLVSFLTRHHGGWTFSMSSAKAIANYGFGQSLGKFANYLAGQGDNFIIGRYLGAASLGIYGRSYQLMMVPTNLIGTVLDKVMFPVMAGIQQDNKRLAEMYVLCMSLIAMISVPITAFVFVCSEEIIELLLGKDWLEAAPILKILIMVLFFRISYKVSDALSRAKGSVYRRAWRQAIFALSVFVCAYAGSFYGLEGVTYGVTVSIVLNYLLMLQLSRSLINFNYSTIFFIFIKNMFLLAISATCLQMANNFIVLPIFLKVLASGIISVFIFAFIFFFVKKLFVNEISMLVSLLYHK